jgi:hypothetical protein
MDRASANVKAERLNHARELLQRFDHLPDAVAQMVRLQGLSASSLSLPAAGPPFEATGSHRRHQGRFHREALPRVGTTSALVREHNWPIAKRNRQPGVAGGPEAEKRAWLGALHRTATLFNWNIDSIVCSSGNWSKPTNCWYPRYVGRLDQLRRTALRR